MAAYLRRWRLAGLVATVVMVCGCNLISLPYFLLFGYDDRYEPACAVFDKPKEQIKVLLVAAVAPETHQEFLRADRVLCELLARYLAKQYKEAKVKVVLVPMNQVENYKDKHPNWQSDLIAMGDCFHADYVINLDLDKLSLYQPNSMGQFFQGHAEVAATVLDVHNPDENPVWQKSLTYTYPTHGPESIFDTPNASEFRDKFLSYMVKQLSHNFASYTMDEKNAMDD